MSQLSCRFFARDRPFRPQCLACDNSHRRVFVHLRDRCGRNLPKNGLPWTHDSLHEQSATPLHNLIIEISNLKSRFHIRFCGVRCSPDAENKHAWQNMAGSAADQPDTKSQCSTHRHENSKALWIAARAGTGTSLRRRASKKLARNEDSGNAPCDASISHACRL